MAIPIHPVAGYVVVKAEKAEKKTSSGLYLPDSAKEKPKTAKVLAVGPGIKDIKVGDRVIYKNDYEATTVKMGDEEYILVFFKNVIATVN